MAEARTKRSGVALRASIVLNLFLAAIIGGHVLRKEIIARQLPPELIGRVLYVESRLSPEDARTFRRIMSRDAPTYTAAAAELKKARREINRRVTAEPFDRTAVNEAIVLWGTDWNHFLLAFSHPLVDALAHISPDGRRSLVLPDQPRPAPARPGNS